MEAFNNLAVVLAKRGKVDEAPEDFRSAVSLDPSDSDAQANLGRALLSSDHPDQAIAHLKMALQLGPETADLHTSLGAALLQTSQAAEAIPHFQKSLHLAPRSVSASYLLGEALVETGRGPQAAAQWRAALELDPDRLPILDHLASLLAISSDANLRDRREAVAMASHAAQLTPAQRPQEIATLSAACAEVAEFDKAIEWKRRATDLATRQGDTQLAAILANRLAMFRAKTPIRQP